MNEKYILLLLQATLVLSMVYILILVVKHLKKHKINPFERFFTGLWIGFLTDLMDTLGIGSFATTTTFFKLTKMIDDDKKLPGTMTAVHVLPVLLQSLCFILVVKVEIMTLITMAVAAFLGAFFGTRITKNWHTPTVQRILGSLLIIAALIMIYRMLTNPGSNLSDSVHGLRGIWLFVGIIFNFITGILMTMGLGNYAPELIFFSLMGLSPAIAMPVMMLDAAMMLVASTGQFIKNDRVSWTGFAGMVTGGVIGVLVAVLFLTNLDIESLKKLVIVIVILTGILLIRSSFRKNITPNRH